MNLKTILELGEDVEDCGETRRTRDRMKEGHGPEKKIAGQ
jgi:hypothetical protein